MFSCSHIYHCPDGFTYEIFKDYVMKLPVNTKPELFGLHSNAEILTSIKEAN